MRLTTILCQLTGTFAGFLSTVRYLPAVALVSYLFDRSHSWYAAFQKIFVLVQGTFTPQVIRHDRRTKAVHAEHAIGRSEYGGLARACRVIAVDYEVLGMQVAAEDSRFFEGWLSF